MYNLYVTAALLSPLIDKYGIRRVAIAGVLINFLGTFTASAATGVGSLCLTYGLVAGKLHTTKKTLSIAPLTF